MAGRYPAQLSGGQRQRVGVARALAADPPLMLMDEPFGAIDPINRSRLQDEFLRLQATVRKTVVFVTHDIDEAIKMGDRIAIISAGGRLAQYDTPARILSFPADDFVAEFVGADRAIKRLALSTVAELELAPLPAADPAGANGAAGTAGEGAIDGPVVHLQSSVREALSQLLTCGSDSVIVLDEQGRPVGMLNLELIQCAFEERVPHGRAAAAVSSEDGRTPAQEAS